ncbi:MAG: thiol reductase thioredoxin [Halobacteriovoraceae bacterium]|nr:thiol reductase thioredoxin [Halobacteriovoraceae bacterium]|tara:strand:+ start:6518 stop:6832 length:315 start_codon:yes stop_codon:yes gene_type:complete
MLQELEADNLQEIVEQNPNVIVQYGASWCGVCKIIKPKFTKLSDEHTDVKFIYVDAEKFPKSRELANVSNLPTFAGFANGKLVKQAMGSNESAIKGVLDEIAAH